MGKEQAAAHGSRGRRVRNRVRLEAAQRRHPGDEPEIVRFVLGLRGGRPARIPHPHIRRAARGSLRAAGRRLQSDGGAAAAAAGCRRRRALHGSGMREASRAIRTRRATTSRAGRTQCTVLSRISRLRSRVEQRGRDQDGARRPAPFPPRSPSIDDFYNYTAAAIESDYDREPPITRSSSSDGTKTSAAARAHGSSRTAGGRDGAWTASATSSTAPAASAPYAYQIHVPPDHGARPRHLSERRRDLERRPAPSISHDHVVHRPPDARLPQRSPESRRGNDLRLHDRARARRHDDLVRLDRAGSSR